jgi:outer membrane protein assembly factor BamB
MMCRLLLCALCLGLASSTLAGDWPQYRGPELNGISTEKVDVKWAAGGPKTAWKIEATGGFSSFAVAGGRCFTLVSRNGKEVCIAVDAKTGKEQWAVEVDDAKYQGGGDSGTPDNKGGDGPRSTPTVAGGIVYTYSQGLNLHALDAATGRKVWQHSIANEFAGRNISWKNASSPVVEGGLVIVGGGGPGQSLLAFDAKSGAVAWKTGDEMMTHGMPTVATIHGVRQVIFFLKSGLVAVSPKDGKELWRQAFPFNVSTAIMPVVADDIVYCSAGYGVGGGAYRIAKSGAGFKSSELWRTPGDKDVANHWSTPVHHNGHLYGMFSFKKYGSGPLKCVDLKTGKIAWEQQGFGAGNVTLVNGKLLALADDGNLVVVEAMPAGYKEVARHKAIAGKCWSTPAYSDGRIYLRSTKEGVCLDPAGK